MKPVLALVLLLSAAYARADEASCTYTYNLYSKSIVKTCRGNMPVPALGMAERTYLITRSAQSCVVKVEYDRATKKSRIFPAVCA